MKFVRQHQYLSVITILLVTSLLIIALSASVVAESIQTNTSLGENFLQNETDKNSSNIPKLPPPPMHMVIVSNTIPLHISPADHSHLATIETIPHEESQNSRRQDQCNEHIYNGGFEYDSSWQFTGNANYSNSYAFSGLWSAYISTYGEDDSSILAQEITVPALPGDFLIIDFDTMALATEQGEQVYIIITDSSGNLLSYALITYDYLDIWSWHRLEPSIVLTDETLRIAFGILSDNDTYYTEVNFDNVSVRTCSLFEFEEETPTPYYTATRMPTNTRVATATRRPISTPTPTPYYTATRMPTNTRVATATQRPINTPTPTPTNEPTRVADTATPSPTATRIPPVSTNTSTPTSLPSATPIPPSGDAYEIDDLCVQAQKLIVDSGRQEHTFHQEGDEDWAKVELEIGNTYEFSAFNTSPKSDLSLELYPSCHSVVI